MENPWVFDPFQHGSSFSSLMNCGISNRTCFPWRRWSDPPSPVASRVTAGRRLYDWFSEYRLRAAGREDILEKVGRLGAKNEWLLNGCWLMISSPFHRFFLLQHMGI